jgi:hypothetical protein
LPVTFTLYGYRSIWESLMFTHMVPVKKLQHSARGTQYELLVYQVAETGEHRIFVSKGGFGVGDVFTASQTAVADAMSTQRTDLVDGPIKTAIDDIDRNDFGKY